MSHAVPENQLAAGAVGPLREVWFIAWPTILTMTSYTVMQFVDKLMVGQIGPLELAAQGNGGIWSFLPVTFAFGMLSVVNTYVSQNLGAGRRERTAAYAWAAVWLSVIVWLVLLVPWGLALPALFARLHTSGVVERADELVRLESSYALILIGGSIILMMGRGIHHFFFGLHRPKVVAVAALAGNLTNVVGNYVLIFGENGLPSAGLPGVPGVPALGIVGAALATVMGTAVEAAIPAAIFLGPRLNRELGTRRAWRPRLGPMLDLVRLGWPASVQFASELTCWSIFMTVLVGRFGADHMAAGWIALGFMHLSFMPAVGCSVAVTSLVGRYIGAMKPEIAVARARLGVTLALVYMTVCAAVFLVFRHQLIALFVGGDIAQSRADHIVEIGGRLLICAALFQTVDALGIVYTGALRGAGDTIWPGVVTILYSWVLIVAVGWAVSILFPHWASVGPWVAASLYIIAYGLTMAWRFESGRWRSINLLHRPGREEPASGVAPAPEARLAGTVEPG